MTSPANPSRNPSRKTYDFRNRAGGRKTRCVQRRLLPGGVELLGPELGERVDPVHVVGDVPVGEMLDVPGQGARFAVQDEALVDVRAFPAGGVPAEEPDPAVGIPAGVLDPASEIEDAPGHGERGAVGRPRP